MSTEREPEPLLSSRRLVVGYGGRGVLPPLDLTVRPGEFWAVVGANGSGKTTLLRTLLGLLPRISGGLDWSAEALPSYVAQRSELDESLPGRVEDFVRSGSDRGWSFLRFRRVDGSAVREALEAARCERWIGMRFTNLSEGQRGRVRIARALVSKPNILVLDEPTSAVDSTSEQSIFETLDELRRTRGVTLVVVSHRTHVFAGRATHAVFIDRDVDAVLCGAFDAVARTSAFQSRFGREPMSPHAYELPDERISSG